MAVSADSYFSNSIIGTPQVGADIDIFETSATPKYAVGFGFTRADGNKYRYVHAGALVARGTVVATDVSESNLAKIENVGATVAGATKKPGETLAPNVAGSRYMQLVITATANQFAGGYINVCTGSGSGYTYRIAGNTATSAGTPTTGNIYLDLKDPIASPIDSNTDIIIAGCTYANVEGATTTDAFPAGVAVTGITSTAFGWVCTRGIIGALQDINIGTVGRMVTLSTNTTGAIQAAGIVTGSNYGVLGYLVEAGSSADYSLVYLTLE